MRSWLSTVSATLRYVLGSFTSNALIPRLVEDKNTQFALYQIRTPYNLCIVAMLCLSVSMATHTGAGESGAAPRPAPQVHAEAGEGGRPEEHWYVT